MNDINFALKQIIIKNSKKEISEYDITEDSILTTDFGFDSVRIVKLIVDLESEFGIVIEDEELEIDVLTRFGTLKTFIIQKKNC